MIWLLIFALLAGSVTSNSYYPTIAQEIANELSKETRIKIGWLFKSRIWCCIVDYTYEDYSAWTNFKLICLTGRVVRDAYFDIEGVAILFGNLTAYYKQIDGVWHFALLGRED